MLIFQKLSLFAVLARQLLKLIVSIKLTFDVRLEKVDGEMYISNFYSCTGWSRKKILLETIDSYLLFNKKGCAFGYFI